MEQTSSRAQKMSQDGKLQTWCKEMDQEQHPSKTILMYSKYVYMNKPYLHNMYM